MTELPQFTVKLLHPRYWLTWLGIGVLWLVVQLPYSVIFRLGKAMGHLAMRLMKRRARIAYRNLELCFPEMSEEQRHQLVVKNFESVGMGVLETGMAWFWSNRRISRWTTVINFEPLRELEAQKKASCLSACIF